MCRLQLRVFEVPKDTACKWSLSATDRRLSGCLAAECYCTHSCRLLLHASVLQCCSPHVLPRIYKYHLIGVCLVCYHLRNADGFLALYGTCNQVRCDVGVCPRVAYMVLEFAAHVSVWVSLTVLLSAVRMQVKSIHHPHCLWMISDILRMLLQNHHHPAVLQLLVLCKLPYL